MPSSVAQVLTAMTPKLPPGPRGHFLLGSYSELKADWFGYAASCVREFGSIVRFRMPWPINEMVLVNDPAHIERVFLDDVDRFEKWWLHRTASEPIAGKGMTFAEGSAWREQRRMVQPAFHRARIATYVERMGRCAEEMVDAWTDGSVRDVYNEGLSFTISVAAQTLFASEDLSGTERVHRALRNSHDAFDEYKGGRFPLPLQIPTPSGRRLLRTSRELTRVIFSFIEERRRAGGAPREDLLGMLMEARDEAGTPISDEQIRDEAIGLFIGATETAAIGLSWTLYLLAQHPDEAEQVRAEAEEVVGDGPVTMSHLPRLQLAERAVKESLRLFPPAGRLSRQPIRDYELEGLTIRKGTKVAMSPYLVHRDPRFFDEPERFNPSRWTPEFTKSLPRFAYFPFGGGQRICIGAQFAMSELITTVATVLSRVKLEAPAHSPRPHAGSLLLPEGGIPLTIRRFARRQKRRLETANG
jgi:cytochrome P450